MEINDRKKRFDAYVSAKALQGYIIIDKNSENLTAVLKKEGEKVNHLIHFIITCIICFWGIVWLVLYLNRKKESRIRVSIDDSGNLIEEEVRI
jgi:hypothetical protein